MAAVEKIEGQRKPDDFFGHRNREHKGVAEIKIRPCGDTIIIHRSLFTYTVCPVVCAACSLADGTARRPFPTVSVPDIYAESNLWIIARNYDGAAAFYAPWGKSLFPGRRGRRPLQSDFRSYP